MKSGWHTVKGYEVYVEDDKVMRGIGKDHNSQEVTVYPYSYLKEYNSYTSLSGELTLSAFRSRLNRGTVIMK